MEKPKRELLADVGSENRIRTMKEKEKREKSTFHLIFGFVASSIFTKTCHFLILIYFLKLFLFVRLLFFVLL